MIYIPLNLEPFSTFIINKVDFYREYNHKVYFIFIFGIGILFETLHILIFHNKFRHNYGLYEKSINQNHINHYNQMKRTIQKEINQITDYDIYLFIKHRVIKDDYDRYIIQSKYICAFVLSIIFSIFIHSFYIITQSNSTIIIPICLLTICITPIIYKFGLRAISDRYFQRNYRMYFNYLYNSELKT